MKRKKPLSAVDDRRPDRDRLVHSADPRPGYPIVPPLREPTAKQKAKQKARSKVLDRRASLAVKALRVLFDCPEVLVSYRLSLREMEEIAERWLIMVDNIQFGQGCDDPPQVQIRPVGLGFGRKQRGDPRTWYRTLNHTKLATKRESKQWMERSQLEYEHYEDALQSAACIQLDRKEAQDREAFLATGVMQWYQGLSPDAQKAIQNEARNQYHRELGEAFVVNPNDSKAVVQTKALRRHRRGRWDSHLSVLDEVIAVHYVAAAIDAEAKGLPPPR